MPFTREELAAMAAADREIEENFCLDPEDMALSRELDRAAKLEAMTGDKRKVAAQQKAYREAHKDQLAARKKAWYEAHKDQVAARKKAYREAHKDQLAARQKAYREARKRKNLFALSIGRSEGKA